MPFTSSVFYFKYKKFLNKLLQKLNCCSTVDEGMRQEKILFRGKKRCSLLTRRCKADLARRDCSLESRADRMVGQAASGRFWGLTYGPVPNMLQDGGPDRVK